MRGIVILLVALVAAAGCQNQPSSSGPKLVSVMELGRETGHLVFFNYIGSDSDYHHFTTAEGKRYKVALGEWNTRATLQPDGKVKVFMTVKDGKLTVPDPKEMARLSEEGLLDRPYKKKR